jgi:hypothetical protein
METANQEIALGTNHWKNQHFAHSLVHPVMGKETEYMVLMKDPDLQPLWKRGFGNETGRLFQCIRDIQGTNTCFFVELKNIPKNRQLTYGKIVCDYKPHKKEKERVRLTVGGDRLDYSGDVATSTADITTFKNLINSTLSTKDAEIMMMDIKNYNLSTPLPWYEYMRMLLSIFSVRNCRQVQPQGISHRRLGIHRNKKGHLWIETRRLTGHSSTTKALVTIWLLSSSPHTGHVVT